MDLAYAVGERILKVAETKLDGAVLGTIGRAAEAKATCRKDDVDHLESEMRSGIAPQ